LRVATTKTRRALWVELHPALAEAIEATLPHRRFRDPEARLFADSGADALRTSIAKACKAEGIPLWSPHDLRHRRISLLHLRGVPWARIAEFVGQRDLTVTANCLQPCDARRGRARLRGAARMTVVAALASLAAAGAAAFAAWYARETIQTSKQTLAEARLARREDERDRTLRRIERMGELLGVIATESELGRDWFKVWATQKLLAITLAAVGPATKERLPRARAVSKMGIGAANYSQAVEAARTAQDEVRSLLDEIAEDACA